jgi:hypothetical protein
MVDDPVVRVGEVGDARVRVASGTVGVIEALILDALESVAKGSFAMNPPFVEFPFPATTGGVLTERGVGLVFGVPKENLDFSDRIPAPIGSAFVEEGFEFTLAA